MSEISKENLIFSVMQGENLTQEELADQLNLSRESVNKMKNGKAVISAKTFFKIKERFGEKYFNHEKSIRNSVEDDFVKVTKITANNYADFIRSIINKIPFQNKAVAIITKPSETGNFIVLEILSDSMNDSNIDGIKDGELLLLKELDKKYISYPLHTKSELYVLVTTEGIVCRQIINHDLITGIIKCHAWNKLYKDYELNLVDVLAIYAVKSIIERKINIK